MRLLLNFTIAHESSSPMYVSQVPIEVPDSALTISNVIDWRDATSKDLLDEVNRRIVAHERAEWPS